VEAFQNRKESLNSTETPSPPPPAPSSPPWGSTVKLIAGLTLASLVLILLIYFRAIIGPLLLATILTYLLHPIAAFLSQKTRLSWRGSVNIIYLLLLIMLLGLSTATGVVIVQQIQSLIRILQQSLNNLPAFLEELQQQKFSFGPIVFDLSQYLDLDQLGAQLIQTIQPLIGRAGSLVSTFATGAASTVGWTFFILLVSYFTLADIGRIPDPLQYLRIPGYEEDIRRLIFELGRIWNAFLRGQLIIVSLVIVVYTIVLTALGLRYALGIAILAGLARFIPYAGPWVTNIITFLVAFFQAQNIMHAEPLLYAGIIILFMLVIDQIFDNMVSPRIMGETLGVNPGAVLVAAILAANLIGIVGLVLAAPVLATVRLLGNYVIHKLFDLDPWQETIKPPRKAEPHWLKRVFRRLQAWRKLRKR